MISIFVTVGKSGSITVRATLGGGGAKKHNNFELAILLFPFSISPCPTDFKDIKMSSEDPWEMIPLECLSYTKNMAKIQRKWPQCQSRFCSVHNFFTDAYLSIPLSLLIYIFPIICINNHI